MGRFLKTTLMWLGGFSVIIILCYQSFVLELMTESPLYSSLSYKHKEPLTCCGDWTPYGNLGNETFDIRMTAALSDDIPSCGGETLVGRDYVPRTEQLYCHPSLSAGNRSAAVLAFDMQCSSVQPEYSIIAPSHCVASVLKKTVPLVCQHTVGSWEVIFVLDASWDKSLQVIKDILLSATCQYSTMVRARVLVQPTAIFETSSDNLGYTLANPSHFFIELQADMFIKETGWNRNLARPIFEYNDIYSVSGRCGHGQGGNSTYYVGRCFAGVEKLSRAKRKDTVNSVYVTATNNRGPILYRADALKELGFLDEVNFLIGNDDHDLNRRAAFRGWFAAYKYTNFYTPLNDSPQRNKEFKSGMPENAKQSELLYRDFRRRQHNYSCDPAVPFGAFHAAENLDQADKRPLHPMNSSTLYGNSPLPPLPPLPGH